MSKHTKGKHVWSGPGKAWCGVSGLYMGYPSPAVPFECRADDCCSACLRAIAKDPRR